MSNLHGESLIASIADGLTANAEALRDSLAELETTITDWERWAASYQDVLRAEFRSQRALVDFLLRQPWYRHWRARWALRSTRRLDWTKIW